MYFAIRRRTKWGSNCIVTGNKRFYNDLLLDKFKQQESSQLTKLYSDTSSLKILSFNLSHAIIEHGTSCSVTTLWIKIPHLR